MQVKLDYSLSSILGFLNDDRRPEKAQANQGCIFMDEEDGCSIDLYRNLNGGQNTNTAVKHESHLLKKKEEEEEAPAVISAAPLSSVWRDSQPRRRMNTPLVDHVRKSQKRPLSRMICPPPPRPTVWLCKWASAWQFDSIVPGNKSVRR